MEKLTIVAKALRSEKLISAVLLFRVNTVSYYLFQEAREAAKTKYNTADVDYNLNDEDVFELGNRPLALRGHVTNASFKQ